MLNGVQRGLGCPVPGFCLELSFLELSALSKESSADPPMIKALLSYVRVGLPVFPFPISLSKESSLNPKP